MLSQEENYLKVIKSGIKPNKIVFSGVGKTEEEIRLAIKKNILLINVESENEAILINKIASKLKKNNYWYQIKS